MSPRRTEWIAIAFWAAGTGLRAVAADHGPSEGPPIEPPPAAAVWPARTTGADLFASRVPPPTRAEPRIEADGHRAATVFPWVLIAVREETPTLRLMGHTGTGRNLRGVFVLPAGGTVLAKVGQPVGVEGLTVRTLELRRAREKGSALRQLRAVLVREPGGELLTLETAAAGAPPAWVAVVRSRTGTDTREIRAGDRFGPKANPYTAGPITQDPPTLMVRWTDEAGREQSEILTLLAGGSVPLEKGRP
jgi:hypothetical protein